ncbi:hypothetical protein MUK42_17954 [Musa troglodytarum]|uniref:Uncharacterized protein n=1 Tax=Musa troglodytarum TaxID=320322 RepID=A0A9E7I7P1_9LILI|nr:hypothetical protein MUK42_17954 [Musa troglodytarum]
MGSPPPMHVYNNGYRKKTGVGIESTEESKAFEEEKQVGFTFTLAKAWTGSEEEVYLSDPHCFGSPNNWDLKLGLTINLKPIDFRPAH